MHLIGPLVSGIVGAPNGSAILLARGTTTPVIYYLDFEASQGIQGTLAGIPLDGNGSLVVYVNQLTDVMVLDANGVTVREFVAGDEAPAVEVISQSFTGTRYSDGAIAAGYPTTLQAVLDLVLGSFGTTNFKVLSAGSSITIQAAVAAFSGLFFNVKTYGAIGDGVADDAAPIAAAIAAAAATSTTGGLVFFPPGIYRSTASITLPTGVSLMGTGALSSKLAFDSAVIAQGLLVSASHNGVTTISGMCFTTVNTNFVNPLVAYNSGIAPVSFLDCFFGGDAPTTKGKLIAHTAVSGVDSNMVVERCVLRTNADIALVTQSGAGRITIRNSSLGGGFVGAFSSVFLDLKENFLIDNCRFEPGGISSGTVTYIQLAPTASSQSAVITNNRFGGDSSATVVAIKNTLAAPIYDCMEYGNTFGDSGGTITAYSYTTDGYAALATMSGTCRAHGSRIGRCAEYITNGNQQIDAKQYDTISILRNGAGAQNLTATKGSLGDKLTVAILNETVGALTPVFAAPDFAVDPTLGGAALNANANTRSYIMFEWMSVNPSGTAGQWVQIAKANQNVA